MKRFKILLSLFIKFWIFSIINDELDDDVNDDENFSIILFIAGNVIDRNCDNSIVVDWIDDDIDWIDDNDDNGNDDNDNDSIIINNSKIIIVTIIFVFCYIKYENTILYRYTSSLSISFLKYTIQGH